MHLLTPPPGRPVQARGRPGCFPTPFLLAETLASADAKAGRPHKWIPMKVK